MEEKKEDFNIFEVINVTILPLLRRSRKLIFIPLICAVIAFFIGYTNEKQKNPLFSSKITYMLEDEIANDGPKSASSSQLLMALAGQSQQSNKGIMVDLSLSNKLIELTLLREVLIDGKSWVLVNYYIAKTDYGKNDKLAKLIYPSKYEIGTNKEMDYYLRVFSNNIKLSLTSKMLESGLIKIEFSSNDELFTKIFVENHFNTISDFYIQKKQERSRSLVTISQRKRDSLLSVLQGKTYGAAQISDNSFGSVMKRAKVAEVQINRDLAIVSEQYKEAVLAYSAASIDLERKKPFISIVDDIRLPLVSVWPEPTKKGIIFGIVGLILGLGVLIGSFFGLDFIKGQRKEYQTKQLTKS